MKLTKAEKEELKKVMRAYLDKIYELTCVDIEKGRMAPNPPHQVDIVNRFLDMKFAQFEHTKKKAKKK
jgi:23S rRNA A1618 N6-methylase RlmF